MFHHGANYLVMYSLKFQMDTLSEECLVVGTNTNVMMLLGPSEVSKCNLQSAKVLDSVHFLLDYRSYQGVVMYKDGIDIIMI
jgi:hypothetical protein